MLLEILDSRHNTHMPIREPKYIIEAKEKLSKSVINFNTKRQHKTTASVNEQENQTVDSKRFKNTNISIKTSATIPTAVIEQDDCIIVSYVRNYIPTANEMASRRRVIDAREISLSSVKENVLPINSKLNDYLLDLYALLQKHLVSKHKVYII